MPVTTAELLANRAFRLELLVEGDLGRPITWVHSSDMPDPAPYLSGGELVLTAGIWYLGGATAAIFADGLARVGAAAVGFGTTHLLPEVPEELVRACERARLPLFRVPDDVPFIALNRVFVDAYVADRARPMQQAIRRAAQLADSARRGAGTAGALRALRGEPFEAALIVDRLHGLLAHLGRRPAGQLVSSLAGGERLDGPGERAGYALFPVPVTAADAVLAVAAPLASITIESRAAIDQVLAFVAIELERQRAIREVERRYALELFDLIALGDAEAPAIAARLRALGLDPDGPLVTICCEAEDPARALVLAERALADAELERVLAVRAPEMLAVVQAGQPTRIAELIAAAIGGTAAVGAGAPLSDVQGLHTSLVEARHACRFIRRAGGGHVTHDQIGSHALLLALQDEAVLDAFRVALLGPLLDYDARRGTELVETLDRFLGSAGRYQETAAALHIHVNSLRLRLERIEELTGRSLASMEDRVDLFIALRATGRPPSAPARRPKDTGRDQASLSNAPR